MQVRPAHTWAGRRARAHRWQHTGAAERRGAKQGAISDRAAGNIGITRSSKAPQPWAAHKERGLAHGSRWAWPRTRRRRCPGDPSASSPQPRTELSSFSEQSKKRSLLPSSAVLRSCRQPSSPHPGCYCLLITIVICCGQAWQTRQHGRTAEQLGEQKSKSSRGRGPPGPGWESRLPFHPVARKMAPRYLEDPYSGSWALSPSDWESTDRPEVVWRRWQGKSGRGWRWGPGRGRPAGVWARGSLRAGGNG